MTVDADPAAFTLTFRGHGYVASTRPNNLECAGRWWWLLFDDAWVRVVDRDLDGGIGDAEARALITAWLALNAVSPYEDSATEERGLAWTATEREPLIVEYHHVLYRCWPVTTPPPAAAVDAEPQTQWAVEGSSERRLGPLVDCDDTIVEVLCAVRQAVAE
ncbi:MAG TPA: hypothetical protein VK636_03575 [Gemmatimonadaceae bacterium]|nr:hypothetical protein [Gemmatimonadaceae bacterium]